MDNKFDLNEKINLIYNFNYNDDFTSCYKIDKINHKNIKLDDIKISEKYKESIYKISNELFEGKNTLIDYNEESYTVILKRFSNNFPLTLFIRPYKSDKDSLEIKKNKDSYYSYLLSSLVLTKKTNHILLPIINIDVRFQQFHDIIKNEKFYKKYIDNINNKKHSDLFSINVKEHFLKSEPLSNYIKKNNCQMKNLLFQIIHTLAVIQEEFPNFKHNSLNPSNVYLYLFEENINHEYKFKNKKFTLENHNFDIKITNFENSSISNEKIKKIPFSDKKNKYYDLHYFLNTLLYKNKIKKCDNETEKFLLKILPKKFRGKGKYNFYLEKNIELFKPVDLLKDKYFNSLLKKKEFTNKKSHSNYMKRYTLKQNNDYEDVFGKQNDLIINGNRKINIKKINKKNIKKFTKLNRKITNMKGGGFLSKLPNKKEKNDPFVSNDNRTTNRKLKKEFTKPPTYPVQDDTKQLNKENTPFATKENKQNFERIEKDKDEKMSYYKDKDKEYNSKYSKYNKTPSTNKNQQLLAEQKIYDISKPPPVARDEHPLFVPINDNSYPYYGKLPYPYTQQPTKAPIQKIYNIGLAKPNIEHATLARVYEDVLPGDPYNLSFNSINERKQLINYIRNLILEDNDGEIMNITIGNNSLLSHLKLIELNPYALGKHPYKELPRGFLLYNAAYPIRHNSVRSDIDIGRGASGANVRIYKLSIGALRAKTISNLITYDNFEVWREIRFYEYIKNNILITKQSPNFINLVLYKTDTESKINWNQLTNLIYDSQSSKILTHLRKDEDKINDKHKIKSGSMLLEQFMGNEYFNSFDYFNMKKKESNHDLNKDYYYWKTKTDSSNLDVIKYSNGQYYIFDHIKKEMIPHDIKVIDNSWTQCTNLNECLEKMNIAIDSGKSLVSVTEAPTCNFISWGSPTYTGQGAVKRMIATGHHSIAVWESIIFQFIYTFAVLQKHNIYFRNMSLEKNFFIKDIFSSSGNNKSHWIYTIDEIDFYIPNYGHILVFDSSFVDKKIDPLAGYSFNNTDKDDNDEFKIYSDNIFKNNGGLTKTDINDLIYIAFKELIRKNNFTDPFKKNKGNIDNSIINLLESIYKDEERDISKLLLKHFRKFMNNRIGTLLKESEVEKINLLTPPKFNKKKLVVIRERFKVYKWGLYLGDSRNQHQKKVLIKDENNDFIEKELYTHSIINYPDTINIDPLPTKNLKLDPYYLIEQYKLNI